ncbi:MAG: bifunctional diaminohydroxyphosphoribosylaminopyrimidine deaminase/5-amino-6-(5-phosphoribosylamino)uracil reductase RibD [Firmicutes bacterium]|nr:bifunctional diaminohydroxyphosphoribosylaminopyrimidine deaminase/5-amino-6-(5-phosphoribosylamino)uracil reductase RibD [Bacillota bacterium]
MEDRMEYTSEQISYMKRALELAEKARGFTEPNPLVGAVIVKDGEIVGEGYHKKAGTPHAEINAISDALHRAMGATMYVTLEPCSHYGKTPPCATALIRAGIKEVFIALEDPNPLVNGKGIKILEEAGIKVHTGLLRNEAIHQNRVFLTNQIKKRAYIALKSAQSIDGKSAPKAVSLYRSLAKHRENTVICSVGIMVRFWLDVKRF